MKKTIIIVTAIILLVTLTFGIAMAQTTKPEIGFNMVNATSSIKSIADSNALLDIIPEGGSLSFRYRFDKDDIGKPVNNADYIKLYKWCESRNRKLSTIFTAGDADNVSTLAALQELSDNNIPVPVIEFVNEAFYPAGGYSFQWSLYEVALLEFVNAAIEIYPNAYYSIPLAPRPTDAVGVLGATRNHETWNDAAISFINSHTEYKWGVSIHIYLNGNEVPVIGKVFTDEVGTSDKGTYPAKRVYNYTTDFADEAYYSSLYEQATPDKFWNAILTYLDERIPSDVPVYITELGITGTGSLNGSYVYAEKIWEILCAHGQNTSIASLNIHGGFTLSRVGAYAPRNSYDVRDTHNPNNVSTPTWDAVKMYMAIQSSNVLPYADNITLQSAGTYFLTYSNNGVEKNPVINVGNGLIVDSYSVTQISATRISAIATSMQFTSKGSVIGINEVSYPTTYNTIKPISFGYIKVVVISNCNPIPEICNSLDDDCDGSVDEGLTYTNYYQDFDGDGYGNNNVSIYRCFATPPVGYVVDNTDYDDLDSTIHEEPVKQCLRKRWLFTGLPCKPVKTNCNCK